MNGPLKILLIAIAACLTSGESSGQTDDVCECMKMKVSSADTVKFNTYLNYKFTLKNTCSTRVWVNTGLFSYAIYDVGGKPTKRLRELTFVKRYKYPDFVQLAPNAEYEFKFADDAFYEYKLKRHTRYVLGLRYNNKKLKHPSGKNRNFLCDKEMKRVLYVK